MQKSQNIVNFLKEITLMDAPNPLSPSSKIRILLVEDYEPNVLVASSILESMDCEFDHAADGKRAVQKISEQNFDVILMDLQMPVMDGLEATRVIRAMEKDGTLTYHPYIIAMTAHALKEDRELCLRAGMDDYISKPFELEDLTQRLSKIAGKPLQL